MGNLGLSKIQDKFCRHKNQIKPDKTKMKNMQMCAQEGENINIWSRNKQTASPGVERGGVVHRFLGQMPKEEKRKII